MSCLSYTLFVVQKCFALIRRARDKEILSSWTERKTKTTHAIVKIICIFFFFYRYIDLIICAISGRKVKIKIKSTLFRYE